MNHRGAISIVLALLLLGTFASAQADSWALPKQKKYYSPGNNYYLEVTPKKVESQLKYFEDKVEGKNNSGALKGKKENRAKGAFYARRTDGEYTKKWEFPLLNEVSPVSAIVSSNGDYVVTFDNWHEVGYGDNVIVIYRSNGQLVKKFGLEDLLTEGDIETFPRSISSMRWGGEHYIQEANGLLVLKIVSNRKRTWEENATYHELKIELATGRPLEAKRDLFPQLRVFGSIDAGIGSNPSDVSPGEPVCVSAGESFDSADSVRIPAEQFYAKAKERPLPSYPAIAKLAHLEDIVIVEMLVSKAGDVICARSVSGHPILRAAAVAIALKWKFKPFESSGNPVKAVGTIAFTFKLTEKDVNPNNQPHHLNLIYPRGASPILSLCLCLLLTDY